MKRLILKDMKFAKPLTLALAAFTVLAVILAAFLLMPVKKIPTYAPKKSADFTVIIDAGHGGRDEGTKFKNVKEKDITLAIARQIAALAPQYHINAILSRTRDTFMNPVTRVNFAVQQNADAYVSIHVNELHGYSYVSGMQVYVSGKNPDFNQSRLLGSAIAQDLGADFKINHALQDRAENIYVLADNFMPSVLVECGFITNPSDLKMLTDSSKTLDIAKQVLNGISAYASHQTITEYAVQQVPSPRRSSVISSSSRIKKLHRKGSKAV